MLIMVLQRIRFVEADFGRVCTCCIFNSIGVLGQISSIFPK